MRVDKIGPELKLQMSQRGNIDDYLRVIIKLKGILDPEKVNFLRSIGTKGALEETIFISALVLVDSINILSDQDWVLAIEATADQTYHPDPPKWLVQ